jgi:hypothetical protein
MNIAVTVRHEEFAPSEVKDAVAFALRTEGEQARSRRTHYETLCHAFERQHNQSSDEFLSRFESGELGDDAYTFDWYAAKKAYDLWDRRYRILSEASV